MAAGAGGRRCAPRDEVFCVRKSHRHTCTVTSSEADVGCLSLSFSLCRWSGVQRQETLSLTQAARAAGLPPCFSLPPSSLLAFLPHLLSLLSLAPLVPRHIMIDQTSSSFLPRPPAGDPLSSRFCLYTLQRQQQHQRRRQQQPPWREKITCYLQQHLLPKHSPTFIIKVLFLSGSSFAQPFSPALRLSSCHRMWIK